MTTRLPILCHSCQHWHGNLTCTSFPAGIPGKIIRYGGDHRQSIAGEQPFALDESKRGLYDQWVRFGPHSERGDTASTS